ncbi:MAG: molybdenum ABC transporter ATP-binding protein [Burkholderiaceae bacterium]|nr:molybdenum ABC transporter ATP-binding protein [Burkholderiaceae bacterium]
MIEASLRLDRAGFSLAVDFAAPGAGITALFGPSGCGKTTVLRAVAGLARARGRVALGDEVWQDDAKDLFIPTHRRSIGYVVQESALFPHMSVRRNLEYGLKRGTERDRRRQVDLDGLVELLGIGHLLERRPTTLSGGERQRVAIARALVPAPRLLLMDEPLAALDAERKAEILPYLERLHDRLETPVLYVSHSIDEVARLADQVLLMRDGHVEAAGEVTGMLSRTDLSIGARADASVVIDAKVVDHDAHYGLTRIRCAGGELWVGELDAAPGCPVRARIMARDVSIARERPQRTSVINVLPAVVEQVREERSTMLLRLRIGEETPAAGATAWLLARITRRSFDSLALAIGDSIHAQVKGVALMRGAEPGR